MRAHIKSSVATRIWLGLALVAALAISGGAQQYRKAWVSLYDSFFTNGTAVSNTVTETELLRTPIPKNYLKDGKHFRLRVWGQYSTTSTPTLRFGSRLVASGAAATTGVTVAKSADITGASGVTTAIWQVDLEFTVRSDGSSGTLMALGTATVFSGTAPTVGSATGAPGISAMGSAGITVPATVTVDFTVDKDLLLTMVWGTASASNTVAALEYSLEDMN